MRDILCGDQVGIDNFRLPRTKKATNKGPSEVMPKKNHFWFPKQHFSEFFAFFLV